MSYNGSPIARDRTPLDPEAPHLPILGRGYIGPVPWAICSHGDNLRIAIGCGGEDGHVEIDVSTRIEFDQLLALAGALFGAHKEIPL